MIGPVKPGSWVVTFHESGKVYEFFDGNLVAKIDREKATVETISDYLGRVNQAIRAGNVP